jgi:hypothetical protein
MKRSSTYLYKNTLFSSTLYPEIPFNNNATDSYYQAILDSPTFHQTGVDCNLLDDPKLNLNLNNADRATFYSNFFELLYSSNHHYSNGKLLHPHAISPQKLIYTTIKTHKESPTFDVYDKNGSNGQLSFFANYVTATYNLSNQVASILTMFNIK